MANNVYSSANSVNKEEVRETLQEHIIKNKIKFGAWVIRLFTLMFTVAYIFPIFGNSYNIYYKILMCNAATSALRLYERIQSSPDEQPFFHEDSFHYLFYSLIFLYAAPVTLVLTPIFLFTLVHVASYTLTLLDFLGQNSWWGLRFLISLVEFQMRNIFRICALTEIIMLPFILLLIYTGRAGLLTPFIYFHFLKFRLASRRNPFTRNVFYEISNGLRSVSQKPAVPIILRRIIERLLIFIQQMVPVRQ